MAYDFIAIEQRWQHFWAQHQTFRTPNPGQEGFDPDAPKYYVLDMFPYPSGVGLHVGHPLGYIATDIVARYKRMTGHNVLHPMGYDAFGLPAEQFAVEHGVHPRITTEKNIANMTRQLKRLGLSYDWDRCLSTTDADYYRWTQWVFLQMFNSWFDPAVDKARPIRELVGLLESEQYYVGPEGELIDAGANEGLDAIAGTPIGVSKWFELSPQEQRDVLDSQRLAYVAEVPVNWCPALGTVLANEEVTNDGRSERGNHPVFKRPLWQWMLRITAYAPRLLEELNQVDWPEPIKIMQRNWIGRSEGAYVYFSLEGIDERITVYTTRLDTLFGATYMVLAPEHPLVDTITAADCADAVDQYRRQAAGKTDVDRQADVKEKTGVFTGAYAVNPVNEEKIPIWIADYVMMGYGTGAIMAVPAHDQRDFEFAQRFDLPIRDVVYNDVLAAVCAFCQRYVEDRPDVSNPLVLMTDFLGLRITWGVDYDLVWDAILNRRQEDVLQMAMDPARSGENRGAIAGIWYEALASMVGDDLEGLCQAAAAGTLIQHLGQAQTEPGVGAHSANDEISLDGMLTDQAKETITAWLESKSLGKPAVQFKLRDWLFSRQRYWGEPFPILHGPEGEVVALDESELPVELPPMEDFKPTASDDPNAPPQPPLGRAPQSWRQIERDGVLYTRELNTMPQWAGSCWYYLRFLDPHNADRFVSAEAESYWMDGGGIDLYVGGAEHAVLHLLYARFWHKVLYDLGHVSTAEPFGRLFNQGYIQAHAFTDERGMYVEAQRVEEKQGKYYLGDKQIRAQLGKMGKSLKNAIAPDEICEQYGCDTLRLYEMYLGPLDQSKPWRTRDIVGVHRFLQRLWRNLIDDETDRVLVTDEPAPEALRRQLHKTVKRVTDAMESMSFNVAIAALIELNNELVALKAVPREVAEPMLLCLGPIAPHMAEELWHRLGHGQTIAYEGWPGYAPALLVEDEIEYPVQINGKLKSKITVSADADDKAIEQMALADEKVVAGIEGMTVRKVIVVKGRMVNIVAKG